MDVNLDRRITIRKKSVAQDATYGTEAITWALLALVWAEWVDAQPSRSDSVRQGLEQAANQARVRIRYREDVDSSMRVEYRGYIWQIIGGPAEIGRREYIEFVVERYTSSGEN